MKNKNKNIKTEDTKKVYVVYVNTDNTEGRGHSYPHCVCDTLTTSTRYAFKKGVQGSNAPIYEEEAYLINSKWYAPSHIIDPSSEDIAKEKIRLEKEAIKEKCKKAGISEEEIKKLIN